nr:hypothetical protein [Streptomyces pactum]
MRSSARSGSTERSRPTRQAARARRTPTAGLSDSSQGRAEPATPSRRRSAAARPPTVVTTGTVRSRRRGAAPARSRASVSPCDIGATHRSSSSGWSTPGSVSTTGPGPSSRAARGGRGAIAVIGRDWNSHRRPSASKPNSMSWGPPNTRRVRSASRASRTARRRPSNRAERGSGGSVRTRLPRRVSW